MFEKLESVEKRYEELTTKISDPSVIADNNEWRKLVKEHSSIEEVVSKYREYKQVKNSMEEAKELMEDKEIYTSRENSDKAMPITKNEEGNKKNNGQVVYPIISNGDTIGTVILLSKEANTKMNDVEKKLAQSAASFLGSQMEIWKWRILSIKKRRDNKVASTFIYYKYFD